MVNKTVNWPIEFILKRKDLILPSAVEVVRFLVAVGSA